jgi:hypothetical protein
VVGRDPPKALNLCRTTPTILCLLLFVLLFFLDLLFLLLYVLLLFLHVFLLLLQVFLCFLYVLLLFLYVLLFLLASLPHTHPGSTPVPGEPFCKNPQAINKLYYDHSISFPAAVPCGLNH